ncbi:DUF1648 domain-containing protein [Paenibacillus sp. LMG 31460]|uniref:DUF1648 domain-containing protein n=1 Tax=Paenibacillus germinis TaxID=2654979 RepID=A0ABX1ZCU4_9BACL|nr:DUF1648 domain-containing protein [Paenibacillus germinis]
MLEKRPVFIISKTITEKILDGVSILVILCTFGYLAYVWTLIPERIPIHFNGQGKEDGWGNKFSLFLLPVITLILYIGLTVLSKYPHTFNYPYKITNENATWQYGNARLFMNCLKMLIVVLFGYVEWTLIQIARGNSVALNIWIFSIVLLLILGTVIFFFIRSIKLK